MPHRPRFALLLVCSVLLSVPPAHAAVSEAAARLRNVGLAQLENEQPAEAEATFRRLVGLEPREALPFANLAVAHLRQQETAEALTAATRAARLAPENGQVLAIQAEALAAAGREDDGLAVLRRAVAARPDDVEIVYQLYRLAGLHAGEAAEAARAEALDRLARLRPENAVVLLERARTALDAGERKAAGNALLRLRELVWQAPQAEPLLAAALEQLAAGDAKAALLSTRRLENVLKVSPMYQAGLRELTTGVVGLPLLRFAGEPPPADFGPPVKVELAGTRLDGRPTAGAALAVADLDGDRRPDVARLVAGESADAAPRLEVRLAARQWRPGPTVPAPGLGRGEGLPRLLVADLDNDGHRDLLAHGPAGTRVWLGRGDGGFAAAPDSFGLAGGATAAAVLDHDLEGDLDVLLTGPGKARVFRNALQGTLAAAPATVLPELPGTPTALVVADLDRDGDPDLAAATSERLAWVDNLRQGGFADASRESGLARAAGARALAAADLDNDGLPDLVAAGGREPLAFLHNRDGRFSPWRLAAPLPAGTAWSAAVAFDADNDGRLDLAVGGTPRGDGGTGLAVLGQRGGPRFAALAVSGAPAAVAALAAADLDGDGDLDLVAAGPHGLHRLDNRGGNANRWLSVRLRGLAEGSSKNNVFGAGAAVEVWDGHAYQFREATGEAVHFGLGRRARADLLRVVWPNGVPQDRVDVAANQLVVEEQVLKGSCPFLYAWDGERVTFVTDLLWGAPIGLPVAPGVWAGADATELVHVSAARPDAAGAYRLFVTEELWEAAFFDRVRLWVVDHPAEVEVASTLKILPGRTVPEAVLASREVRPVAAAWDGRGEEVTGRVRHRDEVYADGYPVGRYQGVAAEPWSFTFDLGEAPAAPVRLHLDGWIFPADASLNLAVAQRDAPPPALPRLEVEVDGAWQVLVEETGFPAGKTKTMVVDTPPLPPGARRLRLVTGLWLGWDRVAWSTRPADGEPRVAARLEPTTATLRWRGFSAPGRSAPNGPHVFDYGRVTQESPWLPFPGRYTRYGEVGELLAAADDRSVILAPGDEIALVFDAAALPAPPAGWRRTAFLESTGWDKDADRNTWQAQHVEPLPFHGMSGYPYGPGESFPDTPLHRRYREHWLTREVAPNPPSAPPRTLAGAGAARAPAAPEGSSGSETSSGRGP